MWPVPNVMAAQPNIGGALCKSYVIPEATYCVDGGEIWHGGGDRRTPKTEIFTEI